MDVDGNEVLQGGCLCGAVRFEVTGAPKWCANCHCSMCRRAHGAPVVTWTGVAADDFRVVAGVDELERYRSSPEATRSFCRRCGSTFLFESTRWAGESHLATASLDEPHGQAPLAHAFWDDRVTWMRHDDSLMRMGGESGTEPLPDEPAT